MLCSPAVCLHIRKAGSICWVWLGNKGLSAVQSEQNRMQQLSAASQTESLSLVGSWKGEYYYFWGVSCFYIVEMSLMIDFFKKFPQGGKVEKNRQRKFCERLKLILLRIWINANNLPNQPIQLTKKRPVNWEQVLSICNYFLTTAYKPAMLY